MKTKSTSAEVLMLALLLAPLAYAIIIWPQLSPQIASQYNLRGEPARYVNKSTIVWLMAGASLFIYLLLRFLPVIDPKRALQPANYQKLRLVVTVSFALMFGWLLRTGINPAPVSGLLAVVGLLLAGIGNYLTTVKPNYFVGIRTPWTLESETVWRRTHRLAGRLLVAGGLLAAGLVLVLPVPYRVGAFVAVVVTTGVIPLIYSYVYFRREKAGQLN